MENCVFCQIVKGKSPCYKIYEDNDFFGLLDMHPQVPGHSLLIPKKHYQRVYDVPNFGEYWEAVLKVTKAIQKVYRPENICYMTYGIHISHAHVHILPQGGKIKGDFSEIAEKIKQEI